MSMPAVLTETRDVFELSACLNVDPEIMFPVGDPRSAPYAEGVAAAKAVCAGCPIVAECLARVFATEDPANPYGVWAGTSPAERTAMRRADRTLLGKRITAMGNAAPARLASAKPRRGRPRFLVSGRPRQEPTAGQRRGLIAALEEHGEFVPSTISGSIMAMMVRDGFAERTATPPAGCVRGTRIRLTDHGREVGRRVAREELAALTAELDALALAEGASV